MTKESFVEMLERAAEAGKAAVVGMVDGYPCGGAYLTADGRSDIVKLFKKYGEVSGKDFGPANTKYTIGDWSMRKGYPTGFTISAPSAGSYQNMDMHAAENNAYVRMFGLHNLPVGVRVYID